MSYIKLTDSLCPICYQKINAAVFEVNGEVQMNKKCPVHGDFNALLEPDPFWFDLCNMMNCKKLYDGYFIDVANGCNISCSHCFHPIKGPRIEYDNIIRDAEANRHLAPFILTGGEPTLNHNLNIIIKRLSEMGEVIVLTNGIRLCEQEYFDLLAESGLRRGNLFNVSLSFHPESHGQDIEFLELCRKNRVIITCGMYCVSNPLEIDDAITLAEEYRDVFQVMRIKAISNLWNKKDMKYSLFTSDMLNYMKLKGDLYIREGSNNKVSYADVMLNGINYKLVRWYDITNVDLLDINCPPFYRARDGNIYNFVTACLINEGMNAK